MATYTEHYNLKKPDLNDLADISDINGNMDIIDDEMSKMIDSIPTMSGATASEAGESGVVPAPAIGEQNRFLRGDATWALPGVVTINGRSPSPVTGDITVIEGGGSSSYGSYRLDAVIPVSAWTGSGPYVATVSNQYITANMDGNETWLDVPTAMLGETSFTTSDGLLTISTTVKPTAQWSLHVSLAVNGADVLADVSQIRQDVDKNTQSVAGLADGLAIISNGDTHVYITNGQFVYVRNHSSLTEGLYKATANIDTNGSLVNKVTPDSKGGLNDLQGQVSSLNSNINNKTLTQSGLTIDPFFINAVGGYCRIGQFVLIQIRLNIAENTQHSFDSRSIIISGFPHALNTPVYMTPSANVSDAEVYIDTNGNMKTQNAVSVDHALFYSGIYLADT